MDPTAGVGGLAALLGGLGIADLGVQDATTRAVEDEIRRCDVNARIAGIRWGRLTLESDPSSAAVLLWHKDRLEEIARNASNGQVTSVLIKITDTGERT